MAGRPCHGHGKPGIVTSAILILIAILQTVYSQTQPTAKRTFGHFGPNSLVTIPDNVWDLGGWTQSSFRTCFPNGNILSQIGSNNNTLRILLHNTSLQLQWRIGGQSSVVQIGHGLTNNTWYTFDLRKYLGVIRFSVSIGQHVLHQKVIANATYNSYLLGSQVRGSALHVGENFIGCLYNGVGVNFNKVGINATNVIWNNCSLPIQDRCSQDTDDCWSTPCLNGGTCIDGFNNYTCKCPPNYNGTNCENDLRILGCSIGPCQNGGSCVPNPAGSTSYRCQCPSGFTGQDCEIQINECRSNPCIHGVCHDLVNGFNCSCENTGYTGSICSENIDECLGSPCGNGTCYDSPGSYSCVCPDGFTGDRCLQDLNECLSTPCQNGGTCQNLPNQYRCDCNPGYTGQNCEVNIDDCAGVTCPGSYSRCQDLVNNYECVCKPGYTGTPPNCVDIDECNSQPCQNGATCQNLVNNYTCVCSPGFTGANCSVDINECDSSPCKNNATCEQGVNRYTCHCLPGFTNSNCSENINDCLQHDCQNGATCLDQVSGYRCQCAPGWSGSDCRFDIDDCQSHPCKNGATCNDYVNYYNCTCVAGFRGSHCEVNIDDCIPDPCKNNATCEDRINDYFCNCTTEWMGKTCEEVYDACSFQPCQNGGTCFSVSPSHDYNCTCLSGFQGDNCEINIDDCVGHNCATYQKCYDGINNYTCACPEGFQGATCNEDINECASNPCQNGATCNNLVANYTCDCDQQLVNLTQYTPGLHTVFISGYEGRNCEQNINECRRYERVCLNGGICQDKPGSYGCYCEGRTANGKLITGSNCEIITTYCDVARTENNEPPCLNGGTCRGDTNPYTCECIPGFAGRRCEINIDECGSTPCQYNGTCVDGINGYNCSCIPGITGRNCEININECSSSPCQHGGICQDRINGYECNCTDTGFKGDNCEINIDDCESGPCQNGATCHDGVKTYNCSCYAGYRGFNCEEDINECLSSPCGKDGKCLQRSNQTLYNIHNPSILQNFSYAVAAGFICQCDPGFTGTTCEIDIDECKSDPCLNNATCEDKINSYHCACAPGYTGGRCEIDINECDLLHPCVNGATCEDRVADYFCHCLPFAPGNSYGGKNCSVLLTGCDQVTACLNGATCVPYLVDEATLSHNFTCRCAAGFTGHFCEKSTTLGFSKGSSISLSTSAMELSLRFRTTLRNGLLVYYQLSANQYITLEVTASHVAVTFGTDKPLVTKSISSQNINDGEWQSLRLIVQDNVTAIMKSPACTNAHNCMQMFSYPQTVRFDPLYQHLYFGNVSDRVLINQTSSKTPYVGCMQDIMIGQVMVDPKGGPSQGLMGTAAGCERTVQCHPYTCSRHGTCDDLWDAFRCNCFRPYYGTNCELEFTPATFGKAGTQSWADFQIPQDEIRKIQNGFDLTLFITTRQNDSLILYLGSDSGSNFVTVEMMQGKMGSRLFCGSAVTINVRSNDNFNDGHRTKISLSLQQNSYKFMVNDTVVANQALSPCSLGANVLYLGGKYPQRQRRRRQAVTGVSDLAGSNYFQGVVQDIEINQVKYEFFPNASYTGTTQSMNTSSNLTEGAQSTEEICPKTPCLHNGTCHNVYYNSYRCDCTYGYRGQNCGEPDFCVMSTCPVGSTCRSRDDGYECVSNAAFDGHRMVVTYAPQFDAVRNLTEISIEFRTRILYGTLLLVQMGDYFLKLRMAGGMVEVNYKIDQWMPRSSQAQQLVNDGQWYRAKLLLKDTSMTIQILQDDKIVIEENINGGFSPVTFTEMVFGNQATIIVASTGVANTPSKSEVPFQGCIGQVRFGGVLLPFYEDSRFQNNTSKEKFVLTSRTPLVHDCNSTVMCHANSCLRGVCQEMWRAYKCTCPPGYTGRYCHLNINDCASSPCLNRGLCQDGLSDFSCTCRHGYKGTRCETGPDFCSPNPCKNNASCQNGSKDFTCNCSEDYVGRTCETQVNTTCAASPCLNNGSCQPVNVSLSTGEVESFNCTCTQAFEGPQCEVFSPCKDNPCFPGNCTQGGTGINYTCQCPPDYTGNTCEAKITYCKNDSCNSNADCVEQPGGFACNCKNGWEGINCTENIDECNTTQPCQHGTCVDTEGSYYCNCTGTGYQGGNCTEDIDECSQTPGPCQNGANCTNTDGNYTCDCTPGYRGHNCDQPTCDDNQCENNSTCTIIGDKWNCSCLEYYEGIQCEIAGPCLQQTCYKPNTASCQQDVTLRNFTCVCHSGWQGNNCTEDVDECLSSPCMNGATCQNTNGSFHCQCADGYEGPLCKTDINECKVQPCQNNGMCTDLINGYVCNCTGTNYTGVNCTDDVDECLESTPRCKNGAKCINFVGGYRCNCTQEYVGVHCEHANPCKENHCMNGGTCGVDFTDRYIPVCSCRHGYEGERCERADPSIIPVEGSLNIWFIIGPIIVIVILAIVIGVAAFLIVARNKRATRGTYSPSRQETCGSRVELGNVLKKPPEERLI